MPAYALTHLSDRELHRDLAALVAQDRAITARLLAHLAEFDARRLYLPAAYPSMYAYCVHELRLSEAAAYKRIQAARAARQFPAIFEAVAEGRLHLSAVVQLAPYLTPQNAADLLAAAVHRTKSEIEELLARRFPRSETMVLVEALPASPPAAEEQLVTGRVAPSGPEHLAVPAGSLAPPMKTGCQGRRFCDPSAPRPSLTSRLFGVKILPQDSLRRAGSHTGQRASCLRG